MAAEVDVEGAERDSAPVVEVRRGEDGGDDRGPVERSAATEDVVGGGGPAADEAAGGRSKDELAVREVSGADIEVKHGLSLSTETVQGLPDFEIIKVFSDRSSTAKGPIYGGVKGRLTASTRTKTAGTVARAGGDVEGRSVL